ncbi:MAG: hypothetical protein WCE57_13945 [Salegentibacter sp.]
MNEPSRYQERIEKPRIFFHLIGLSLMHYLYYSHPSTDGMLFQLIILAAFTSGFFLCQLSWSEKFQASFQKQLKDHPKDKASHSFNLSISGIQIDQLYSDLVRYDLINQDTTSLEDFRNVLLKDWSSHKSSLHLKMDGPSCRAFYDYFTRAYPKNTMTLKNFFITSGLVFRPDGRKYNYNTLKNAPIRTPVSKHNDTLVNIFQKIN